MTRQPDELTERLLAQELRWKEHPWDYQAIVSCRQCEGERIIPVSYSNISKYRHANGLPADAHVKIATYCAKCDPEGPEEEEDA